MTRRKPSQKPNSDMVKRKIGEARFFLRHLKDHRDKQRDAAKPPPEQFAYYLSAFLSAAITVSDLMKQIAPAWWERLEGKDRDLHDLFWEMRGDAVHEGDVETKQRTDEVPVRFDPNHQRVQGFFFQSMFGEVKTRANTHSVVDAAGDEREVVEACEVYLAILCREAEVIEKAG
jgi:hypothetical protein